MVLFTSLRLACEFSTTNLQPFSSWEKAGDTKWVNGMGQRQTKKAIIGEGELKNDILFLNDHDISTKQSGAFYCKVAKGYKVTLRILTDNDNYFEDNTKNSKAASKNNLQTRNANLFDSEMFVTMFEDDYLSIDIDEEESGIFRYRLRLNDEFVNVKDPDRINDETWIKLEEARLADGSDLELVIDDTDFVKQGQLYDEDGNLIDGDITDDIIDGKKGMELIEREEEKKESNGMSWKGVLIIGAVVVGIVLLLRFARNSRTSSSSSSTKSPSDGGSSGE